MVDITSTFHDILKNLSQQHHQNHEIQASTHHHSNHKNIASISPILVKCSELLVELCAFEKLLGRIVEEYVGYHKFVKRDTKSNDNSSDQSQFDESSKKEFDQQFGLFLASFVAELNNLRESLISYPSINTASRNHTAEVINYLFDRLNRLSRIVYKMQHEREKYNISSFKLHCSHSKLTENAIDKIPPMIISSNSNRMESSSSLSSSSSSNRISLNSVSSRYEGEIAAPSKLKEYDILATKYKQLLMREARQLQVQYSEDIKQIQEIEGSVERITSMLSEFVQILQSQSDQVDNIYDSSLDACNFVGKSNVELQTTIDRTKSSQWNIVTMFIFLASLLLLLDWMTP